MIGFDDTPDQSAAPALLARVHLCCFVIVGLQNAATTHCNASTHRDRQLLQSTQQLLVVQGLLGMPGSTHAHQDEAFSTSQLGISISFAQAKLNDAGVCTVSMASCHARC